MKPYIKLTFGTTDSDLVLNVPGADETVQSSTVASAMMSIMVANAIDGVYAITKAKSAAFCKQETKSFNVMTA